jgi:outer membrane protein TolC
MQALRGQADVDTAEANVKMSEAVFSQAQRQKDAGTGTQIDVTRSSVVLLGDRQRLLAAKNFRHKATLQLLRAMRMRLDTELELTDKLAFNPVDAMTLDKAKEMAMQSRPDLKTQEQRVQAAKLNLSAAKFERAPVFGAQGDYGVVGWTDTSMLPSRAITLGMKVPIFDSGRRAAHKAETAAQLRSEQVKQGEMKDQVELEVRISLESLQSAEDQVQVAAEGLKLAESELTQAQRRFEAGVTSGLELTDSQTRLARARDNYVLALFNHNVARVDLGQAMGDTRRFIPVKD